MSLVLTGVILVCIFIYFSSKSANKKAKPESVNVTTNIEANDSGDEIVYVAHTSKKYHNKGCHFITGDEIPIEKSEAEKQGYVPCKVCRH